ncbi:MAG: helix-turn-helix domain-containing protein [Gallionella sp.]|nr:helix-turn-helix domain-containing protein [Gallionella sp.]MDD4958316.1 helix-turn-helix domain-containing protein [Gallionella sp.]
MKRNLFDELQEGFTALEAARTGKITLREHLVEKRPALQITPDELLNLREKLNLSRNVFARYLRTNERTLENWEQGRARPNAQAAIRLVERYPDTVERLAMI